MRWITGDECGLLKEFLPGKSKKKKKQHDGGSSATVVVTEGDGIRPINNPNKDMSRRNGVVDVTWMKSSSSSSTEQQQQQQSSSFAALRIDGSIETWEASYDSSSQKKHGVYQQVTKLSSVFNSSGEAGGDNNNSNFCHPNSPHRALGLQALENNLLCACNAQGNIAVVKPFVETENVVQQFAAFKLLGQEDDDDTMKQQPLATAFCVQKNTVAVGGRDRETVLFDLDTAQQIWKAKNLPPDPQTLLQQPVWPTAACFMNINSNERDTVTTATSNILAVGTAHHQVRIYDVRLDTAVGRIVQQQQRRPVGYTPIKDSFLEYRVTALCPLSEYELVIGDAAGYLHSVDIRKLAAARNNSSNGADHNNNKRAAVLGRFVGPAGSVRQISFNGSNNRKRMGVVGLDRMLRIYDTTTRKQLQSVYLKQRLNCVLAVPDGLDNVDDDDDDMDQEDDVRDYVDSSDEEEGEGSDGNDFSDPQQQDVDDVLEEIEEVGDVLSSSEEEDSESSDDEQEEEEVRSPRKRRRDD